MKALPSFLTSIPWLLLFLPPGMMSSHQGFTVLHTPESWTQIHFIDEASLTPQPGQTAPSSGPYRVCSHCPGHAVCGWELVLIPATLAATLRGLTSLNPQHRVGSRGDATKDKTAPIHPTNTQFADVLSPTIVSVSPQLTSWTVALFSWQCWRKQALDRDDWALGRQT